MTPKQKTIGLSALMLAWFVAAGTVPALADTVLTFDRESAGSLRPERQPRPDENGNVPPQPGPPAGVSPRQTVTIQLKAALARVEFRPMGSKPETAPTSVLLYDGTAQKVYTLDAAAKTYFVQSYKEVIDGERYPSTTANEGFAGRATFAGAVDLKAARANNAFVSKEILGAKTRQYLVSGNVEMKFNAPQRAAGENQPTVYVQRGGGTPGVYNGGGGTSQGNGRVRRGNGNVTVTPNISFTPPSLGVDGEIWSADGISLFTAGRDTPVAAIYRLMLPDNAGPFGDPLAKPLITRLKNMKSLPRESTISFRMSSGFRGAEGAPSAPPMTTHLVLTDMKTDVTLADSLFAVPEGYSLTEPPSADLGRRGGPGGTGRRPDGGGGRRFGGNGTNE